MQSDPERLSGARRGFIAVLDGPAALPLTGRAQAAGKLRRVGLLDFSRPNNSTTDSTLSVKPASHALSSRLMVFQLVGQPVQEDGKSFYHGWCFRVRAMDVSVMHRLSFAGSRYGIAVKPYRSRPLSQGWWAREPSRAREVPRDWYAPGSLGLTVAC